MSKNFLSISLYTCGKNLTPKPTSPYQSSAKPNILSIRVQSFSESYPKCLSLITALLAGVELRFPLRLALLGLGRSLGLGLGPTGKSTSGAREHEGCLIWNSKGSNAQSDPNPILVLVIYSSNVCATSMFALFIYNCVCALFILYISMYLFICL